MPRGGETHRFAICWRDTGAKNYEMMALGVFCSGGRLSSGEEHFVSVIYWSRHCFCFLFRANNRIAGISAEQLEPFLSLETLDLSNNAVGEVRASSFPTLSLKNL